MSTPLIISEVLAKSDLLVDRPTIDAAIARMADEIARDYIGDVPADRLGDSFVPVFLTVMHGGMLFAGQLALELGKRGLDLQFDYMHATRYRGQNQGGELVWKHRPATSLYGRRVLIADDILDEGQTLKEVRRWCIEQGATDVRIAALTVKDHDRCVEGVRADYAGLHLPDRYVFGFGMDYYAQGRNLPAIYALKD
ncbi:MULTISPECIES: hypoxanthine-guanine phosphoribosyltransferase [Pseudoxanthomonas]|uniref:Hypoxanthine phosphoribosyltransferase n=1 Tax=Pseudoxanthomonas taiwanensis J19 TaxID=935569 RepID=A0A562CY09_9GAMM|nr:MULTISPECIES: hypoxanthine-guanine phosphoribosyltransferase [Pseudoxanthomonas]TWH01921.1 hypoxanthine phosphoribosyltransferase [Pseudoxanthomonas taiwanensis J19]